MKRIHARLTIRTAALAALVVLLGPAIALAASPGVHGRVLGHDEEGKLLGVVAAAKIEFQNRSGAKVAAATADKNGYYKVDLPPGEYLYKVEAPGYRKEEAGRGIRLEQSEGYAIFNLALTQGKTDPNRKPPVTPTQKLGKLRGRVLEKTAQGAIGIPDARIALRREGSRELISVRSRAATEGQHQLGDYQVTLEAGIYTASVMAAGYETFTDPQTIVIKPGEETNRDFLLIRPEAEESKDQGIRGVVTSVDSGATPPPIKIQIVPLGVARATSIDVPPASNGAYSQDVPAGRYRVTATAEGFPPASSPPVFVFEGRYTLVNLVLRAERVPEPKTNVDVFVFAALKEGAPMVPVSGATVALSKTGVDPLMAKEATTDATGHAIFAVSEAGEYVAEAHLHGFRAGSGKGTVQLGQSHEIGIELVKEAAPPVELALSVVVSDFMTKKPLAGARVLARHAEQSLAEGARATTDAKGEAVLKATRTGSYTVMAQHFGYEPGGAKIEVIAQRTSRLALALKPVSSPADQTEPVKPVEPKPPTEDRDAKPLVITGYVAYREVTGQLRSVPDAKLVWERIAPLKPTVTEFAVARRTGRYQVEVPVGTYQVRVQPPPGFESLLERVGVDPTTQEKYFIVRRSEGQPTPSPVDLVSVKGLVVVEASGGRYVGIPGAEIHFVRSAGAAMSESGTGGDFGVQLAADAYRVFVRAKGYEPLESRAEVRSGMTPLRYVLKRSEEPSVGFALTINVVERARTMVAALMRPVADAQVQLSFEGRSLSGETNSSGQFSTRVKPGAYTVRVTKPGYSPATGEVQVSNRNVTQQIVLTREEDSQPEPNRKPTLTVRVSRHVERPPMTIKPTGSALAGAQVTVLSGSKPVASGTTSAAGTYAVQLAPGNYSVKVEAQGFAPAGKVAALSDRDVYLDVQLNPIAQGTTSRSDDIRRLVPGFDPNKAARTRTDLAEKAAYVVEYRLAERMPWTELGRFTSNSHAQRALVQAISRRQIPKTAQTRIQLEK
jgi:hypothetical protein